MLKVKRSLSTCSELTIKLYKKGDILMDRFTRGLVCGITGGVVMNIWSLTSYHLLNFTERRFLDWASVLMYGHLPLNLKETVLALAAQILWAGFLGILFAYLIPGITSQAYLLKGAFWGFIIGFLMYAFAILLRMPYFNKISFDTVVSQIIGMIIWGLTLAQMLRWLDKVPREKV